MAGQPGSVVESQAKKERVARCARGQSCHRRVRACRTSVLRRSFTSGSSSSSPTRWYVQKHVLRTLISGFGSNTLFFKNQL